MPRFHARTALQTRFAVLGFTIPGPRTRCAAVLSVGLVILGSSATCQTDAPGGKKAKEAFHHAIARRGCTQEDAPALEIYLTNTPFDGVGDPLPPYIRIEVSSSPEETLGPVSLTLIQIRRDPTKPGRIARAQLVGVGNVNHWLVGNVTLTEAVPGGDVSGRYEFTTPTGKLGGRITAKFVKRAAMCG